MADTATRQSTARKRSRMESASLRRLNWGCGDHIAPGWINADIKQAPGVDLVCDILDGLPLEGESIDYIVSVHALPEIPYPHLVPALCELRRVLKPGGVIRLVLPDLNKAIRAYVLRRHGYFQVDEKEVSSRGGRFITHVLWYGYSRSLFTSDFVEELLEKAGFTDISHCFHAVTSSSYRGITELDNRPDESLHVEAVKPTADVDARTGKQASEATIDVTDIIRVDDDPLLAGWELRRPRSGERREDESLVISGWLVPAQGAAERLEALHEGTVVARAAVNERRPMVSRKFSHLPGSENPGFSMRLRPSGWGRSRIRLRTVLADGATIDVAEIAIDVGQSSRENTARP